MNNQTKAKETDNENSDINIDDEFLKAHTYFLSGEINEESISKACRWLIYENLKIGKPKILTLIINSTGGNLTEAFALIDLMRSSTHTIKTIGIGNIMSSAFMIFASGTKGERIIGRNTSILCHQYSTEMEGKHHDLKAAIREGDLVNERMVNLLVECSELPVKTIKTKLFPPSDVYLTAEQMVELGIADKIL